MLSYLIIDTDHVFHDDIKQKLSRYEFTVQGLTDSTKGLMARVETDNEEVLQKFISEKLLKTLGIRNVRTVIVQ